MNDLMMSRFEYLKMRLLSSYMAKVLIFKLAHFQIFKSDHLRIKKNPRPNDQGFYILN